jgi:predicted  nucleic acid-binding Zn-ribbon protein
MGATLDALLALQDIELQIVDIRRQLTAKQRSVARQATKLRAAEDALAQGRADLRNTQVAADAADLELKSRDAGVNKLRDNLNSVRTNKEYAAILSQLNNEKADRSRVESRALELMNEVEAKRKTLADLEAAVQEENRRLTNLTGQLDRAQSSFADRLSALQKQRDEAAAQVDAKTLDLFNRISERYEGEVMARVAQIHPRRQEYTCEGCNMSLTAERANALMTRDEVLTCGSCGRILHIDRRG